VRRLVPLCALFSACALSAQQDVEDGVDDVIAVVDAPQDAAVEGFSLNFSNSLQFGQTALSNWAPGGESSVSVNSDFKLDGRYIRGRSMSEIVVGWQLGLFKTEDLPVRKTNDQLRVIAVYGYQLRPGLSAGVFADLTTQVAPSYSDQGTKAGDFLSPGNFLVGFGFHFEKQKPPVNLVLTPAALKHTVILDEDVRALDKTLPDGLYGNEGKTVRSEVGAYQRLRLKVPLMENVSAYSDLKFFVNYSDVDVDTHWALNITGKINQLLSASLTTTLIHDNDTDTDPIAPGKQNRVQFMEVFGLSLTYAFQL
jgi:hypothetical protein